MICNCTTIVLCNWWNKKSMFCQCCVKKKIATIMTFWRGKSMLRHCKRPIWTRLMQTAHRAPQWAHWWVPINQGSMQNPPPNKGCAIALMNTARSVLTFPIMQKGTFDECFRLPARSQTQNKSEELWSHLESVLTFGMPISTASEWQLRTFRISSFLIKVSLRN